MDKASVEGVIANWLKTHSQVTLFINSGKVDVVDGEIHIHLRMGQLSARVYYAFFVDLAEVLEKRFQCEVVLHTTITRPPAQELVWPRED